MASRLYHLNINVADLDRSIAFYRIFGFEAVFRGLLDEVDTLGFARAFAAPPNAAEYALIRIGDDPRATCIDLVQWRTRPTHGSPYEAVNHAGIYRFLIHVDDPDAILAALRAAGHMPMGEIHRREHPGLARPTVVFGVRDPDGVVIEVASNLDGLVS
jgi:catechol 2,3-dioxygenase-like lactoylglutathione lyase family enzyme